MKRTRSIRTLLLALMTLTATPVAAEDAEALRRELEQMRRQFEAAQQQYRKAIETLSERIKRLEAQPPPPTPAPAIPAAPTPGAPTSGTGLGQSQTAPPSAIDVLRPREPFTLYGQRGAGQLLFDMGIAGDFVASFTSHKADKAGAATFGDRANRVFPREIELNLFGQVDPYARAEVRIEAGEDTPGTETSVSLAEATLTLLTLPYGFQAKLGQMRARFGLTNVIHEHDLPFVDRPSVLRNFFGEDGLVEKGAEVTWVPDLPLYLEALLGVFNGDNETAFGRGRLNEPLVTGRVRTFFEPTDTSAIQLGVSVARGATADRLGSTIVGYEAKYKYRPEGWLHPLLTLSSEGLYSIRRVETFHDVLVPVDDDLVTVTAGEKRTRHRFGWYGHAELQPWRRWAVGARYDWSQFPVAPGSEWALEPYVSFMPSEFLRFRLAAKHTERDKAALFNANDTTARIVNELLFQATFILGAHPAHPF
jgi:hypothetical protein